MGIYLNPSNDNFKKVLASEIYVDKTMMIREMNSFIERANNYICLSKARRFGKTVAGNMLVAYYSKGCDSKAIFDRLAVSNDSSYHKHLNKYNVIQIDLNSEYQNSTDKENLIWEISQKIKGEIVEEFKSKVNTIVSEDSLANTILKVYATTKETFIILIDEYDVLIREEVSESLFEEYLSFLNGLFKSNTLRPAITLAYMTGILPIVRDKVQSKLNNFDEYTFLDADVLADYVGFTSEEVKNLCNKYNMDYDECKRWYDGYIQRGMEIYSPESVVKSMVRHKFDGYWGKTSSYQVIVDRIKNNYLDTKDDIIKMLSGEKIYVDAGMFLNTLKDFHSKDDVFTYLIHLGYLAYDSDEQVCWIPNKEVQREWARAISVVEDYATTDEIIKASRELLNDTLNMDEDRVARALDIAHIHVTSNRSYNNEDALQSAIYLAYIYALNKYTIVREATAGKGFADVVFIPFADNMPALIIELKRNDSAESGIDQIKEKKYFMSLEHYNGNLLFVGINYDEKNKTHTCRIEKFQKD